MLVDGRSSIWSLDNPRCTSHKLRTFWVGRGEQFAEYIVLLPTEDQAKIDAANPIKHVRSKTHSASFSACLAASAAFPGHPVLESCNLYVSEYALSIRK